MGKHYKKNRDQLLFLKLNFFAGFTAKKKLAFDPVFSNWNNFNEKCQPYFGIETKRALRGSICFLLLLKFQFGFQKQ